jgi:hypothetical protein
MIIILIFPVDIDEFSIDYCKTFSRFLTLIKKRRKGIKWEFKVIIDLRE